MNKLLRRLKNILIGFDQFCQVLVYLGNYSPDRTISGVIGTKKLEGTMNLIEKVICKILTKLESNHCIKSIDWDEVLIKGDKNDFK